MNIRNAAKEDAARIMEIIEDAKASLRQLNIDQWQNGYPNMDSTLRDIENGICRVLVDDEGKIIATVEPGMFATCELSDLNGSFELVIAGESADFEFTLDRLFCEQYGIEVGK